MFQTKFVEKTRTHFLCLITFARILGRLHDNMKEYGRSRQATDHSILWCMSIACRITKVTNTHSEYVIIIARPLPKLLRKPTHYYVLCTLLVLLAFMSYSVAVPCLTKEWSVICQQSTDLLYTLTSLKCKYTCIVNYRPCQFQSRLYAESIQVRLAQVIRDLMSVT